jgi:hypothetical protein|tara:strand:+ start:7556 stop:7708 length:153 start_codon:yes stop_codon:yes gene_type:complete
MTAQDPRDLDIEAHQTSVLPQAHRRRIVSEFGWIRTNRNGMKFMTYAKNL